MRSMTATRDGKLRAGWIGGRDRGWLWLVS